MVSPTARSSRCSNVGNQFVDADDLGMKILAAGKGEQLLVELGATRDALARGFDQLAGV